MGFRQMDGVKVPITKTKLMGQRLMPSLVSR